MPKGAKKPPHCADAPSPDAGQPAGRSPWILRVPPAGWLLLGAALLTLFGIAWGMPAMWDVAADSAVPMGELVAESRDFFRITSGRYPPLHFDVLRLVLPVADGLAWADRRLGTGLFENPKLLSALYIMPARIVSAAMGVATVMLVYSLTKRMFGANAGLFAGAVMALSPLTQYYAKNANLDMPYVFWLAVALWFLASFFEEGKSRALVWAGLAAAAAVCTKDQAYGFLILLPVPILLALRQRKGGWAAALQSKSLWQGTLVMVAAFLLAHRLPFAWARFAAHVRVITGPGSEGWRETAPTLAGLARLLVETLARTADALTLPVLAAGAAGFAWAWKRGKGRWVAWGAVGYWLTFLAVVGYVYPRFVLPYVLALAPFAGAAMARVAPMKKGRLPWGGVLVGLALAWMALRCAALMVDMEVDSRMAAQHWIEENVGEGETLAYLGPERDMPRFSRDSIRAGWAGGRLFLKYGRDEEGQPLEDSASADEAFEPDVLIVSLAKSDEAAGLAVWGGGGGVLRRLGGWGRSEVAPRDASRAIMDTLAEEGYEKAASFRPLMGRLAPDVSPSAGRVLFVLRRKRDLTQSPHTTRARTCSPPGWPRLPIWASRSTCCCISNRTATPCWPCALPPSTARTATPSTPGSLRRSFGC